MGSLLDNFLEKKRENHISVKIIDDTTTTYARKKKMAIWTKNFGLSLTFGDVTALQMLKRNITQIPKNIKSIVVTMLRYDNWMIDYKIKGSIQANRAFIIICQGISWPLHHKNGKCLKMSFF